MGEYERQCICDEAPNFTEHQKFILFDILHRTGHEQVIKVTKNQNDSVIDLSRLPPAVIERLYKELVNDTAGGGH